MLQWAGSAGQKAKCPDCGCFCRLELKQRAITSVDGPAGICEPVARCKRCQRSFFPQRERLGLDSRELSPGTVSMIVFIGGEVHSSKRATVLLERLGMGVSCNTVQPRRELSLCGGGQGQFRCVSFPHSWFLQILQRLRPCPSGI